MSDDQNQPVIPAQTVIQDNVIARSDEGATKQSPEITESTPQEPKKEKKSFFKKPCKDCEKIKKESEEFKNNWQRALADYKNLQRETSERRGEWARMSEQQILEDFIPVYENFKKAFSAYLPLAEGETKRGSECAAEMKQWENWKIGISYIMKQFWDVLKAHNVEEIKTVGEKFDPKFHEAVGEANEPESASDSVQGKMESGMIVKEVDGGYKMGEKIIKVAKVIITK